MALYRKGALVLRTIKPALVNPCCIIPCSINFQVRYAARKFFREKARKKKEVIKNQAITKEIVKIKRKYTKIEKTLNLKKPEPPNDDVIIMNHFNYKKFSLTEAVKFHREYHHPTVYNNPKAMVSLKIEINMTGKTKHQFIKPFSGVADIPHPFLRSHKKEVLVLCNPEDKELALSCGASIAGGVEVVQKIKEGVIQPSLYEYIIAHINFLPQMTPIRTILKDQLPKAKLGTLTNNLKIAIPRFLYGIEYSCVRMGSAEDFGFIDCAIGTIDMDLNHLEENLKALLKDIEKNKPRRDGDFISWIWCTSPPSPEEFSVDLSLYLDEETKTSVDEEIHEVSEVQAAKALKRDYQEEKILEKKN